MKNIFKSQLALVILLSGVVFTSCDDDDSTIVNPDGGTISGGPFTFIVDGTPDFVSGITVNNSTAVGSESTWVITDEANNILGLPSTTADLEAVDFDMAGPGLCFIWYLRYEGELTGNEPGQNIGSLTGNFDLSNSIAVERKIKTGSLAGGPFVFDVDGTPDFISELAVDRTGITTGDNITNGWIITDDQNNILGLPMDPTAVDFDAAGIGVCFVWYITYVDGLTGLAQGNNIDDDLVGLYDLSNPISVTRSISPGTISGGPFTFDVDGTPDFITELMVDRTGVTTGDNIMNGWVVTDDQDNILGLPADPTMVDFDAAGPGICFVWYITYDENLSGLEAGNNFDDLEGFFALSNGVEVTRNVVGASISGGPFTFTVDGTPDFVSGIMVDSNGASSGETVASGWVITDDNDNILGLPGDPTTVDFDAAGVGVCFIWYINYLEGGLTGLEQQGNLNDLEGFFALSNGIRVDREDIL